MLPFLKIYSLFSTQVTFQLHLAVFLFYFTLHILHVLSVDALERWFNASFLLWNFHVHYQKDLFISHSHPHKATHICFEIKHY